MQIKKITTETYSDLREIIKVKSTIDVFLVDSTNGYFSAVNGILYNKDKTILYAVPNKMKGTLVLPEETMCINYNACLHCQQNQIAGIGVTNIRLCAFKNSSVKKVCFPSLHFVGDWAFNNCINLQEITMNQVIRITEFAFANSGLKSLYLPHTLEHIDENAFTNCTQLEQVEVEDRNTRLIISSETFKGCSELKQFIFDNGLLTLGKKVFKDAGKLELVKLPHVEEIPTSTFYKCPSLQKISLASECKIPPNLQKKISIDIRSVLS